MIKFIGYLIVLIASAKIGYDISERYRNRTKELRSVQTALEIIRNEINFNNRLIGDALLSATTVKMPAISDLFEKMAAKVSETNSTISKIFADCIKEAKDLSLNNDDIRLLEGFFSAVGTGGSNEELINIDSAISAIGININAAMEDENKYVKLFRTTGILAGLMIGTIFI